MYLVCDGGGTKTEYMLFDLSGHIHGFSKTQGTNAIFINPDAAADAVCGGISDCLQQAGIRDTDLNEICLFIPGFKNSANAVRDRFPKTRLMVLGDEYNAYYGALGNREALPFYPERVPLPYAEIKREVGYPSADGDHSLATKAAVTIWG